MDEIKKDPKYAKVSIKMLDGFADEARKKGYKLNIFESQSQAIKAQLVLLRIYLSELRNANSDVLLIPDNMARQLVYSNFNAMPEEFLDLLKDYYKEEIKGALLLYIPIEFALPWDRHPSETFHKQIDEMMIELRDEARISGTMVFNISGKEMDRVKLAMEAFREYYKPYTTIRPGNHHC